MGRAAKVFVTGPEPTASELAGELVSYGFDARSRRSVAAETVCDALVCLGEAPPDDVVRRVVVKVGPAPAPGETKVDAALPPPAHPIQIAARLRALLRLTVLESVARLRETDAAGFGVRPARLAEVERKPVILYVGPGDPAFLSLRHALKEAGVDMVAAFSTFNAFDYLHERPFDAVVLNAADDPDTAHTVCSAMRRNTRLYHTPALIMSRDEVYPHADEAFARGASDILPARLEPTKFRARVLALADERRRRREAKAVLESVRIDPLLDRETDLFTSEFGLKHLESIVSVSEDSFGPVSVVCLRAGVPDDIRRAGPEHADKAVNQFAAMLRHCVRAEDLAMRAGGDLFFLALPGTPRQAARVVAARVCAIAECTAYESADPLKSFRIHVEHGVEERIAGESAADMLERARLNLDMVETRATA